MDQALIDVMDAQGHLRFQHRIVSWPLQLGRHASCGLSLDDPHLAPHHAEIRLQDGQPRLQVLPSLNGAWFDGQDPLPEGEHAWPAGATLNLGEWKLRLRHAGEALPPEQPLQPHARPARGGTWAWSAILAVSLMTATACDWWVAQGVESPWHTLVGRWMSGTAGLVLSSLVLSLLQLLFQRRFQWPVFLLQVLRVAVVSEAIELLAQALAGMSASPWPLRVHSALEPWIVLALVLPSLHLVWPRRRLLITVCATALCLLMQLFSLAQNWHQPYWFGHPYAPQLPPPAFDLAPTSPASQLQDDLDKLRQRADAARTHDGDQDDNGLNPEQE